MLLEKSTKNRKKIDFSKKTRQRPTTSPKLNEVFLSINIHKAHVSMDEKHTPDRLEASESIRKHQKASESMKKHQKH